jgi:exo-beta-1,3-glucanase (GH17 family)
LRIELAVRLGFVLQITLVAAGLFSICTGCTPPRSTDAGAAVSIDAQEEPFVKRPFNPFSGGRWIGNAIAYGPFRDGQYPGGPGPTRDELRQDLELMSKHWNLLRMYGATGEARIVLDLIEENGLDMKVMLGAWIDAEEQLNESGAPVLQFPEAGAANRREVESAIRLANAYPEIVAAISVGNETQVFWSSHRVPQELLIGFVREMRARTAVPVTVADDFNFWNKPESGDVALEVDFIMMHAHPLWNGLLIDDALDWTRSKLKEVQAAHPGHAIVLGETGWATRKHNEGGQAELMKGQAGERQQKIFYEAINDWARQKRIATFFFEAFDENWKGGEHPNEVEKHWGLFRADRTPKEALAAEK